MATYNSDSDDNIGNSVNSDFSFTSPPGSNTATATAAETVDPYVRFFDERFQKSREFLIFMEETKVYQRMLENCTLKAGPDAPARCRDLVQIVQERIKYYNSKYRKVFRPTLSPGIPEQFEKRE